MTDLSSISTTQMREAVKSWRAESEPRRGLFPDPKHVFGVYNRVDDLIAEIERLRSDAPS